MKKLLIALTATILTALVFSTNAHARSAIKRLEPEMVTAKAVAMALETYAGDFYDLSDFAKLPKARGNAKIILNRGMVKLKSGEYVDANSIKYFFVHSRIAKKPLSILKAETIEKRPNEEE